MASDKEQLVICRGGQKQVYSDDEWSELIRDLEISPRESVVARLLVSGYKRDDVAQHLDLSVHTVNAHARHIFRKLDVNRVTELGAFFVRRFRQL